MSREGAAAGGLTERRESGNQGTMRMRDTIQLLGLLSLLLTGAGEA